MFVSGRAFVFFHFTEMFRGVFLLSPPLQRRQHSHPAAQESSHGAGLGVLQPCFGIWAWSQQTLKGFFFLAARLATSWWSLSGAGLLLCQKHEVNDRPIAIQTFFFFSIFSITIYTPYSLFHLYPPPPLHNHHPVVCVHESFCFFAGALHPNPPLPPELSACSLWVCLYFAS